MKDSSKVIFDNHGRPMNYLRLAVTDRCNLRCFYCMPAEGIQYIPKKQLLSYEEMLRLASIMADSGVNKVRITGGEPFVRKDLMQFLKSLVEIDGIEKVNMTTNGILTSRYLGELKELGITTLNLSLDTLNPKRFLDITRRDDYYKVENTLYKAIEMGFNMKINMVVMEGKNDEDILSMAKLTKDYPVNVRYIEEMPFNGSGDHPQTLKWNYRKIHDELTKLGTLNKIDDGDNSTSKNFRIDEFKGSVGIIAAFSRTFCNSCNRIRVTAQGKLKTCLYDDGVMDLRELLRNGSSDEEISNALIGAYNSRAKDGFEAEKRRSKDKPVQESMSTIGG